MNLTYFVVHHELSDEAAAQLCELLNDLAFAFERQYLAQTRRYYEALRDSERSCHNGQLDLFAGDDTQFRILCRPHAPPPPRPFVDDGRGGPIYLHHHRVQRAHRGAGARPRPACRR